MQNQAMRELVSNLNGLDTAYKAITISDAGSRAGSSVCVKLCIFSK